MITGRVKMFDPRRGFGFLSRDDGEADVFVHISAIEDDGDDDPIVGDRVEFLIEQSQCAGKLQAANVRRVP
jgi:CspA family cold shock protein